MFKATIIIPREDGSDMWGSPTTKNLNSKKESAKKTQVQN